jgi:phosphoribosylaminoimidazole carboxylase PurE protein
MTGRVVILMGSPSDRPHVDEIAQQLDALAVPYERRVASAHKSVEHVLAIIAQYEGCAEPLVYITVAGRSNALSGMLDANTTRPVLACPPYSDRFGGADLFSSLRMPSGVAPMVVLEPRNAALAACKILALTDSALAGRIAAYQRAMTAAIVAADNELQQE